MRKNWNYARCVSVLTGQIEILKKISDAQNVVKNAVISRKWADFDVKIADFIRMGEEFALLEDERASLFSAADNVTDGLSKNEENHFYALVTGLPIEESRELSRLYRELKMETLKIRARNETFLVYLNEAKTMAAAYLEAVCPARGGKLYTRKGHRVSQDLRSIVINNRF